MLISLVGLPGVGKSTIGRHLARRLGFAFVDCDALIERRLGESISTYFQREGEARFRDHEEVVLSEALAASRTVVATGGGAVLRAGNRSLLRERTICVYLSATASDLVDRVRPGNKRPLFRGIDPQARLRELARDREPLYREVANLTIAIAGRRAIGAAAEIARVLETRLGAQAMSNGTHEAK